MVCFVSVVCTQFVYRTCTLELSPKLSPVPDSHRFAFCSLASPIAPIQNATITAVDAYTRGSSYARFSDDRIGTLEPGKEADLAILSQDIFSAPSGEIAKTKVAMTMVAGKVVFSDDK